MNLSGKRSLAPWASVITGEVARRMDGSLRSRESKCSMFYKKVVEERSRAIVRRVMGAKDDIKMKKISMLRKKSSYEKGRMRM